MIWPSGGCGGSKGNRRKGVTYGTAVHSAQDDRQQQWCRKFDHGYDGARGEDMERRAAAPDRSRRTIGFRRLGRWGSRRILTSLLGRFQHLAK